MSLALCVIGFVLYFVYDYNQISFHNKILKSFFLIGTLCLVLGTVIAIIQTHLVIVHLSGIVITGLGLISTIYTLFFALDFDDTYKNEKFSVCRTGVYGLCRHPGVWCLCLFYIGLWITFMTKELALVCLLTTSLNILYVIYQDRFIFPKVFDDYHEYQQDIPFLFINRKVIKKCLKRKGGNYEV